MARVLTNNITLAYGLQSAQGIDPTEWNTLEPNSINNFGATITTVPRDPISKNRQRRKGVVTDLDSGAEFEHDLTIDVVNDFISCFAFAAATNDDLDFFPSAVTGTGYTVPALNVTQGGKLQFTTGGPISLMFARGFITAANNGFKPLSADAASTDVEILIAGTVAEASPPTNAELEVGGIRPEIGDLGIIVTAASVGVSPATAVLSSGNNSAVNNIDFTTLGLTVGQFIHIGGLTSAEQFSAGAGYARIVIIAAGQLDLDKLDTTLATDTGAGETVDLLFGRFIRNVDVDDSDFVEQFITFETTFPGLDNPSADMFQYSLDNLCNLLSFSLPLTDKAVVTVGFIGTDTDDPTDTQKSGASTPIEPNQTAAFSTTTDIARLQVTDIIEEGLSTDFKSLNIQLNNNVSGEKVLQTLGAKFMNTGNFEVDIEAQMLFTNAEVITAIRNNETLTLDWRLTNDDGGIYFDIPNMTMGDGAREFPVNETVLINTTGMAFGDPASAFTYSLGVSQFPIVP
jgi:hypothetical protein